jgi:malonyl-CoA O-methyltransferase
MSTESVGDCLAAYDQWADTYDSIDNPIVAQATEVLASRAAWLDGARVLELGCGTGRNAPLVLAAGARAYVGVDGSPGMLAHARARLADPRVTLREAELVAGAQSADGPFDVVLVCLVLEHLRDVTPVVTAAATALSPGGRLVVIELHPGLHARGIGANFRLAGTEVRLPSFAHTADEMTAAAQAAGLTAAVALDHRPSAAALVRSAKLARFGDAPVLLELTAARPA